MASPVAVSCGICGSDDYTVVYPAGVAQINRIVRCNHCGMMYANPREAPGHVVVETRTDEEEQAFRSILRQRLDKERIQVRDTAKTRARLGQLHPQKGKVIEIGSSTGCQLEAFRNEGWEVLGIEPDRVVAAQAEETLSIPTIKSTLEEAKLPENSVDAAMMLHVIEHVPDPVGTLSEIYRVLKPGGHLVVETPRYDTMAFKMLGRRERSVSCNGHISFFTTDSLAKAYTKAGFELEELQYVGRTLTLDRLAYNLGVMSKSDRVKRALKTLAERLRLDKLHLTINARDMQRVCIRKPVTAAATGDATATQTAA